MSDDFGTINVSRSERAREIEVMREQYRRHRQALQELIGDAPSEQLAQQYSRLVGDIDVSLAKLDELEGRPSSSPPPTEPGMRPLVEGPRHDYSVIGDRKPGAPASRVVLIVLVAIVGLALIGWLIWKASDRSDEVAPVADETVTAPVTTETTETESGTIEPAATTPAAVSGGLVPTPQSQDFGVVRKGTRAVRKFVLRNDSDSAAAIKVSRSACRCLYYQHPPSIGAKKEGTLTVTIDGAKAKAGVLSESLQITTGDPSVKTSVNVNATVR
ncbi:MAG TPA: DUF1573 domain-containing protein [Thermoanaerobaculia bacterium]|nr:DUF1573 domain-containing protein [Thermoanaerobaculia bacterium]